MLHFILLIFIVTKIYNFHFTKVPYTVTCTDKLKVLATKSESSELKLNQYTWLQESHIEIQSH